MIGGDLASGMSFLSEEQKGEGDMQEERGKERRRRPRRPTFSAKKKRSSLIKESRRRFTVKPGALAESAFAVSEDTDRGKEPQIGLLSDEEVERRRKKRAVQRTTAFQQDMRTAVDEQARRNEEDEEDEGPQFEVIDFDFKDGSEYYNDEINVSEMPFRG